MFDRSLLMLQRRKTLLVISHDLDEFFMQFIDLLQRLRRARFNLMGPPSEGLGYLDAQVPKYASYRDSRRK